MSSPSEYTVYLNSIIKIEDKDGKQNSFYKVVKITDKMFYARKLKTETKLIDTYTETDTHIDTDKEIEIHVKKYETRILDEFEESSKEKRIKKTNIQNYSVVYIPK